METSVPLNRPQIDHDPKSLLDGIEGPCEIQWRDFEKFQEGFSIVKNFIENKYKGVTLSIHDEPYKKSIGLNYSISSPYDYIGTFWKLKLDSKTKDVFEIEHIIQDVIRMFKIIGVDLDKSFELSITGSTVSPTITPDTENIPSTLLRHGFTSHIVKKYKREYLERISQTSQTNFEYVSTSKTNWLTSTLSHLKSLVGARL
jgi:hypothetical protein